MKIGDYTTEWQTIDKFSTVKILSSCTQDSKLTLRWSNVNYEVLTYKTFNLKKNIPLEITNDHLGKMFQLQFDTSETAESITVIQHKDGSDIIRIEDNENNIVDITNGSINILLDSGQDKSITSTETKTANNVSLHVNYTDADGKLLNLTGLDGKKSLGVCITDGEQEITDFSDSPNKAIVYLDSSISGLVVDENNKIIFGNYNTFGIKRYTSYGFIDTDFGVNGEFDFGDFYQTPINGGSIGALASDNQGSIIATGTSIENNNRVFTTGIMNDSVPIITTNISGDDDATSVVIDNNDSVIVGGTSANGKYWSLVKYSNGQLDLSFNNTGKISEDLSISGNSKVKKIFVDEDNRITIGGTISNNNANNMKFFKYLSNGAIDTSFGDLDTTHRNGFIKNRHFYLRIDETSSHRMFMTYEKQANSIVIGGPLTSSNIFIKKYLNNGDVDFSFGDKGATKRIVNQSIINNICTDNNGNYYVSFYETQRIPLYYPTNTVCKYKSTGLIDASFANDGFLSVQTANETFSDLIALDSSNNIIFKTTNPDGTGRIRITKKSQHDNYATTVFAIDTSLYSHVVSKNDLYIDNSDNIITSGKYRLDGSIGMDGSFGMLIDKYLPSGNKDNTFNNGTGIILYNNEYNIIPGTLAIDSKSRIIAAYIDGFDYYSKIRLIRYNHDGSNDLNFNNGQIKTCSEFDASFNQPYKICIDNNDAITIAAWSFDTQIAPLDNGDVTIVKYEEAGSVKQSFGTGGKIRIDGSNIYSMILQSSLSMVHDNSYNTIVTFNGSSDATYTFKYNLDGALDTTFGKVANYRSGNFIADSGQNFTMSDQGLFICGASADGDFSLVKYNLNGEIDSGFGDIDSTRKFSDLDLNLTNLVPFLNTRALAKDDSILIGGATICAITNRPTVGIQKYLPYGIPDIDFGYNSIVDIFYSTNTPTLDLAPISYDVKYDNSNNIIIVGDTIDLSKVDELYSDIFIFKYKETGLPVSTFGTNGRIIFDISQSSVRSVVIDEANNIFISGYTNNKTKTLLAKYLADGYLDSTFNNGGTVITDYIGGDYTPVTLDNSNNIVQAIGQTITRYNKSSGQFVNSIYDESLNCLSITNDANDIVVAAIYENKDKVVLIKYLNDNTKDASFGMQGFVQTDFAVQIGASYSAVSASPVIYDNTNNIILAGFIDTSLSVISVDNLGNLNFTCNLNVKADTFTTVVDSYNNIIVFHDASVSRIFPTGLIDNSYGLYRTGTTSINIGGQNDIAYNIDAVEKSVVLSGYSDVNNLENLVLAKCDSNGFLDSTFGKNGLVVTPINDLANNGVFYNSVVDNLGNIILSGPLLNYDKFFLTKYLPSGQIDGNFGNDLIGLMTHPTDASGRSQGSTTFIKDSAKEGVALFFALPVSSTNYNLNINNSIYGDLRDELGKKIGTIKNTLPVNVLSYDMSYALTFDISNGISAQRTSSAIIDSPIFLYSLNMFNRELATTASWLHIYDSSTTLDPITGTSKLSIPVPSNKFRDIVFPKPVIFNSGLSVMSSYGPQGTDICFNIGPDSNMLFLSGVYSKM